MFWLQSEPQFRLKHTTGTFTSERLSRRTNQSTFKNPTKAKTIWNKQNNSLLVHSFLPFFFPLSESLSLSLSVSVAPNS